MADMIKVMLLCMAGIVFFYAVAPEFNEMINTKGSVIAEVTIVDKNIERGIIPAGTVIVTTNHYVLTVSVGDKLYDLRVNSDTYESVSIGDGILVKIKYSDSDITDISLCDSTDLWEEHATESN